MGLSELAPPAVTRSLAGKMGEGAPWPEQTTPQEYEPGPPLSPKGLLETGQGGQVLSSHG